MNCEERSLEAARRSIGDRLIRQLWSLQSEPLCEEARRRTGFRDLGDPPIEPALSILVNSLEMEADLHPLGRFLAVLEDLKKLLINSAIVPWDLMGIMVTPFRSRVRLCVLPTTNHWCSNVDPLEKRGRQGGAELLGTLACS
jgi:hypothetical protein